MTAIIALSLFGISNLFWGFWFPRKVLQILTLLFIAIGIGLTAMDWNHELLWFGNMFRTTNTSINFSLIIQLAAFLVVALSRGFGADDDSLVGAVRLRDREGFSHGARSHRSGTATEFV